MRPFRALVAVVWLGCIAVLTLVPTPGEARAILSACLVCGERGSADAVLNVLLFLPLGLLLADRPHALIRAALAGMVLSLGIEIAQLSVAGRFSTLGDVVWNTLGSAFGVGLHRLVGARLRMGAPRSRLPGTAWAALSGSLIVATGWLLGPAAGTPYWGHWTPRFGNMAVYSGELLEARLDGHPIPLGQFPQDRAHGFLTGPWTLEALVEHAPSPPRALAPIVSVSDSLQREIFLLGVDGTDLVWRERLRAATLGFDQPDLRVAGALERFGAGDTIRLGVHRVGEDRCVRVEGVDHCAHELTPARGWTLLVHPSRAIATHYPIDGLWLIALFAPVGFFSSRWRAVLGNGLVVGAAMAGAVSFTDLAAGPFRDVAAAVAGLVVGWAAAHVIRGRHHGHDEGTR